MGRERERHIEETNLGADLEVDVPPEQPLETRTHHPCHPTMFILKQVFIKLFCKSQFPHKSVNLFFILVMMKDE